MSSRISALVDLDPLSVPLPHGTEVTRRVERLLNGRRVPQGLVGRVVRARDGGFDVLVTGVGELWYARSELTPRRAGRLEYAHRREAAWQSLLPCRVLEAPVGSRAWGLANENSDTDLRGAFALPFSWTGGLVEPPSEPDRRVAAGRAARGAGHGLFEGEFVMRDGEAPGIGQDDERGLHR